MYFFFIVKDTINNGIILDKQLAVILVCICAYTADCTAHGKLLQAQNCFFQLIYNVKSSAVFRQVL